MTDSVAADLAFDQFFRMRVLTRTREMPRFSASVVLEKASIERDGGEAVDQLDERRAVETDARQGP